MHENGYTSIIISKMIETNDFFFKQCFSVLFTRLPLHSVSQGRCIQILLQNSGRKWREFVTEDITENSLTKSPFYTARGSVANLIEWFKSEFNQRIFSRRKPELT